MTETNTDTSQITALQSASIALKLLLGVRAYNFVANAAQGFLRRLRGNRDKN